MVGLLATFASALCLPPHGVPGVLIVADEAPAMRVLAVRLRALEGLESTIVEQDAMPPDLAPFRAVVVYIHGALKETTEQALIRYTRAGGRLVALHHSISSGKRANRDWFRFLGVSLPDGEAAAGGYRWIEGVSLDLVCLAPRHFITRHKVAYPSRVPFARQGQAPEQTLRGFRLDHTEVYLNHVLSGPHTRLLGLRYTDERTGVRWMQETAGWVRRAGRGRVVYLMPGHTAAEFDEPVYSRLIANAIVWAPQGRDATREEP